LWPVLRCQVCLPKLLPWRSLQPQLRRVELSLLDLDMSRNGCKGIISGMPTLSSDTSSLFKRRHFDSSIIILCVRWYITYKLCFRDLEQMMAERGVDLAHTTILRWVQHYVPEFDKRWSRFGRPVGTSWRVDETHVRVRGEWKYLYRAVDKQGNTVDFLLSEHRDIEAAKRFFTRAIDKHGPPEKITLDGYAATHNAVGELKECATLYVSTIVRTSKYLFPFYYYARSIGG
jgi:transposase-like protein